MYDARAVFNADIIHACDEECFLICLNKRHKLLVLHVLQVFSLHFFQYFIVALSQNLVGQGFSNVEDVSFLVALEHLGSDIFDVRSNCQDCVGSQCPGCSCPSQEVFVLSVLALEFSCDGDDLHVLISLRYLVGSQSCSATRAVRQDLMTFIDETCLEELINDPPYGLDVIIVKSDVRIIHVSHVTHALTHISPHIRVCENRITAFLVEFLDSIFFYILLAVHSQLLLDFDFNRKSVGIPAGFPVYLISHHCLISADGILQSPCHYMMDTRLAVGRRRSFIKDECRFAFARVYALAEQVYFIPFLYLFFLHLCYRLV